MHNSAKDETSWIALYLKNKRQIELFFRRRIRNEEDCKDLEQELFIRIHKLEPHKTVEDPKAYLFRIAHNLVNDLLRYRQRHDAHIADISEIQNLGQDTYKADDQVADRQNLALLEQAIDKLPPKCREVFLLRKIEDLPNRQIAIRLGISQNMVEKHLRKALKELRQSLE
ncbi:RNA polymerase sigma factor [Sneathiella limimaris]|uniref:RNA polymerase sigma factor n=1 Tax=Sneathiella limimaris TaxID=1964213 RepID=UPI00146BD9A9|nr:sigma-70 family RNA polymerase sigma factor [Sneathiella limimaris]